MVQAACVSGTDWQAECCVLARRIITSYHRFVSAQNDRKLRLGEGWYIGTITTHDPVIVRNGPQGKASFEE